MKYIINYTKTKNINDPVRISTFSAEVAEDEKAAAESFLNKHPDCSIIRVLREDENCFAYYGMGSWTDEERSAYTQNIKSVYRCGKDELEEIRERLLEYKPEEFAANIEYQNRRETEETQNAEGVHVGDIFYSSWGYDQTNIDFYQVVSLKGKHTLVLRKNKAKSGLSNATWNGLTRPIRDEFEGESKTVRSKLLYEYGHHRLIIKVDDHYLDYAEFRELYDYSTGA